MSRYNKLKTINEICLRTRIVRKNPRYPNLTFEELLAVESWVRITADLATEVHQRLRTKRAISWKKRIS